MVKHEKHWASRLLLLLLLLSAQSFSLAHELSHDAYDGNGIVCQICSASHGLDTAVTVAHFVLDVDCTHNPESEDSRTGYAKPLVTSYIARAPPLNYVN